MLRICIFAKFLCFFHINSIIFAKFSFYFFAKFSLYFFAKFSHYFFEKIFAFSISRKFSYFSGANEMRKRSKMVTKKNFAKRLFLFVWNPSIIVILTFMFPCNYKSVFGRIGKNVLKLFDKMSKLNNNIISSSHLFHTIFYVFSLMLKSIWTTGCPNKHGNYVPNSISSLFRAEDYKVKTILE